jgi:hypothetical protein
MLAMRALSRTGAAAVPERPVILSLPSLAAIGKGEIDEIRCRTSDECVTKAIACGEITPGVPATIAGVYENFVRTVGLAEE